MIVYKNIYNFEINILNQTYNSLNKGNTSQIALNLLFHLNTNSEYRQDNNNVHEQMLWALLTAHTSHSHSCRSADQAQDAMQDQQGPCHSHDS